MKRKLLLLLVLAFACYATYAQHIVSGTITSTVDNEPLPGANIIIKGTSIGTVADLNGKFSLDVSDANATLVISFVGYTNQEVQIKGRTEINLSLEPDNVSLADVLVVGYGTQRKKDLTSSIAVLSPKEVLKMPGSVTEALQGSVAGVNVSRDRVRIRGVNSLSSTDPLWVVDGLIGGQVPNENEIESIQVLKDAASCAIYGSRGANGVIIVTTKKGKAGIPKVEYNAYTGTKYPWKTLDMMNAVDFAEYVNEAYYNYYGNTENTPVAYLDPYHPLADTDWQKEWFRRGGYQNHNLSISGGNESLTYRTGVNIGNDKSTVIRGSSKNIGLFLNSEFRKNRIAIGQSFVLNDFTNENGGGGYFDLLRTPSNLPVYDTTQVDGFYITGTAETGNDMVNQIGMKNMQDRTGENLNIKGTVYSEIELIKGLKYKLNLGIDFYNAYRYSYDHVYDLGKAKNPDADLSETMQRNRHTMVENTLTYIKQIGAHNFTVLAGITSENNKYREMQAGGEGFPASSLRTLSTVLGNLVVSGSARESALYSVLGRINYDYNGKYLATANFRQDASSKFSKNFRVAYFPSVSVGWRLSEEEFIKNLGWISNFKIRASYGQIGNQDIDDYLYESFVESANQFYTFGPLQNDVPAPLPKEFGNPDVKWETTTASNLGIDFGMLDEKIIFTFEAYNKSTEDLLVRVAIPSSSGSTVKPQLNAGNLQNKGIEFSTTLRNRFGDLFVSATGNIDANKNEILKLGKTDAPVPGGEATNGIFVTSTAVGHSIGEFYTLTTDGIFHSQDEINAYTFTNDDGSVSLIQPNASPGDIKFVDLNKDGRINDDDRDFVGSPLPKFSYGFNLNLEYKGFDFTMFWQGEYGQMIFNNGVELYSHGTSAVNQSTKVLDRFRAEDLTIENRDIDGNLIATIHLPKNTDTDVPRAIMNDPNANFSKKSDYFLEDGSYLRLKRVTLGYTLPKKWLAPAKIESCRLYMGAKNLLTFTKYSGYDPEVAGLYGNTEYNLNRGIDMQQAWADGNITTREFFTGIQLTF